MVVKRAHMVSRAYLQNWADQDGRIRVLDRGVGHSLTQKISQATVVKYAYDTDHMSADLEGQFGRIESDGIPAMRSLVAGVPINHLGRVAVVDFLDMHLERGRFADQAKRTAPAVVIGLGIEPTRIEIGLGDRILISRYVDEQAIRLSTLNVTSWRWRVETIDDGLATGDGAVLLWKSASSGHLETVTFPLAPTKLLVLGAHLQAPRSDLNFRIATNSRRWIVDRLEGQLAATFPP